MYDIQREGVSWQCCIYAIIVITLFVQNFKEIFIKVDQINIGKQYCAWQEKSNTNNIIIYS